MSELGLKIQVCLTPKPLLFLNIYCLQREETPNALPMCCYFLSDSDYVRAPVLLEGSRMKTKLLRMSMIIQFRRASVRTLGSNPNRTFCDFDFQSWIDVPLPTGS